jgi:hypothetical protein
MELPAASRITSAAKVLRARNIQWYLTMQMVASAPEFENVLYYLLQAYFARFDA